MNRESLYNISFALLSDRCILLRYSHVTQSNVTEKYDHSCQFISEFHLNLVSCRLCVSWLYLSVWAKFVLLVKLFFCVGKRKETRLQFNKHAHSFVMLYPALILSLRLMSTEHAHDANMLPEYHV